MWEGFICGCLGVSFQQDKSELLVIQSLTRIY